MLLHRKWLRVYTWREENFAFLRSHSQECDVVQGIQVTDGGSGLEEERSQGVVENWISEASQIIEINVSAFLFWRCRPQLFSAQY